MILHAPQMLCLAYVIPMGRSRFGGYDIDGHQRTFLVEPMGFESTSDKETKEFCGATRPSKVLKGKGGNSYCPLNAPRKFLPRIEAFLLASGANGVSEEIRSSVRIRTREDFVDAAAEQICRNCRT
jgi:hypothetical protein